MPTYLPPRRGISHSEAVVESRVYARVNQPELLTLALYHSTFLDQFGNPTGIYLVCDFEPLVATLEDDAPVHGGEEVTFQPIPMRVVTPEESDDNRNPTAAIEIDNVARLLSPYLQQASASTEPVRLIARTYLPDDTTAPHEMPPLSMELLGAASTDGVNVRFSAGYGDIVNFPFPAVRYSSEGFHGLASAQS